MKRRVGDKVTIKCETALIAAGTSPRMRLLANKKVTIMRVHDADPNDIWYALIEDDGIWVWKEDYFTIPEKEKIILKMRQEIYGNKTPI